MKVHLKLSAVLTGAMVAPVSFAQQAGYDIAWGVHAVPLSPALTALIVLTMSLATWAFMRKRRVTGFMTAAAAIALGAVSYNSDLVAAAFDLTISSPTGSAFVECPNLGDFKQLGLSGAMVGTTLPGGVTLTRVEPTFLLPASQGALNSLVPTQQCSVGTRLTPEIPCSLECFAPG